MVASTDLVNEILIAVSHEPQAMFWRANSGLLYAPSGARVRANANGTPDIIGVYRGRAVGFEVKHGQGRLNENQKKFRAAWTAAQGIFVEARSVSDAIECLRTIDEIIDS